MDNRALTSAQRMVLNTIDEFIEKNGIAPTVREIKDELGYRSTGTVHGLIEKLINKGYIRSKLGQCRTIQIVNSSKNIEDILIAQELILKGWNFNREDDILIASNKKYKKVLRYSSQKGSLKEFLKIIKKLSI